MKITKCWNPFFISSSRRLGSGRMGEECEFVRIMTNIERLKDEGDINWSDKRWRVSKFLSLRGWNFSKCFFLHQARGNGWLILRTIFRGCIFFIFWLQVYLPFVTQKINQSILIVHLFCSSVYKLSYKPRKAFGNTTRQKLKLQQNVVALFVLI